MKIRTLLFPLLLMSILLLSACGAESEGRKVVEYYLAEVENNEKTFNYISYDIYDSYHDDRLTDVIDYKFISAEKLEDEKNNIVYTKEHWEADKKVFTTFDGYKKSLKKQKGLKDLEIVTDNDEEIAFWITDKYITAYKYLYNVAIENTEGEKLYKEIEFEVSDGYFDETEKKNEIMKIRDIHTR